MAARHSVLMLVILVGAATTVEGTGISAGEYIALTDGEIQTVGSAPEEVLKSALKQVGLSSDSIVTIYWGTEANQELAERAAREPSGTQ